MTESLAHRGPDSSGIWTSDHVILGHRRLSIIDTSEDGHQPMTSRSGRYVISYNGEIYNHVQLGRTFRADGWQPVGSSDTEVLLEALDRWGLEKTLDRIDGMFAFALFDRDSDDVCLVRDRFGEKPLVYVRRGDHLWFGSDTRAFRHVPDFEGEISENAVRDLLRHGYIGQGRSIFVGIEKVPHGHVVRISRADGRINSSPYWSVPPPRRNHPRRSEEVLEELESSLVTSVAGRLHSDRPLGAFLSGGIDSALTCAIASRQVSRLDTFTVGWSDREYDESEKASAVAQRLGARHHDVRIGETEVAGLVDDVAAAFDEPFADSSALAVLAVAKLARKSVVVCLSGDGGDELFAGYNRHRWLLRVRGYRRAPVLLRRSAGYLMDRGAGTVERLVRPVSTERRPRLVRDKMTKLARAVGASDGVIAYQEVLRQSDVDGPARLLPHALQTALTEGDEDDFLWGLRAADMSGYLPDDVLTKVDRATMHVGLECRTPFLERHVCELAMELGRADLIGRDGGKLPLRALLDRLVPELSFNQPKTGFGVPVGRFLRTILREQMFDAAASFEQRGVTPEVEFASLCREMDEGDDALVPLMWTVLMFESWATAHLGSRP